MSQREGLKFESQIKSDCAALNKMIASMIGFAGDGVHAMRDATRGGLAAVLNEMAESTGLQFDISENRIPVNPEVEGACELLGLDPLYVANEGKVVALVAPEKAEKVIEVMKEFPEGKNAVIIGEVSAGEQPLVTMKTLIGGQRIIDMPVAEQLPRIC
jgi:hydrogenase expression/formation protein HypE